MIKIAYYLSPVLPFISYTFIPFGSNVCGSICAGSAIGFRLDSLLKLTDTRATNNKMTLMHYLCKVQ